MCVCESVCREEDGAGQVFLFVLRPLFFHAARISLSQGWDLVTVIVPHPRARPPPLRPPFYYLYSVGGLRTSYDSYFHRSLSRLLTGPACERLSCGPGQERVA